MMLSAEEYVRRVVAELPSVRSGALIAVERTAEAMARRVLQGGRLYIVDDHSGLTSESGVIAYAMLWTLTSAFIERLYPHGKTPHLWRSIKLPDSRSFNEQAMSDTLREGY